MYGKVAALFVSNTAARGIDIDDHPQVVNYDHPGQAEGDIQLLAFGAGYPRTGNTNALVLGWLVSCFLSKENLPGCLVKSCGSRVICPDLLHAILGWDHCKKVDCACFSLE